MLNDFNEEKWAQLEKNWTAWWNHDLERPLLVAHTHKPNPERVVPPFWHRQWWGMGCAPFSASAEEIAEEVAKDVDTLTPIGDAWPRVWLNFGPGVAAAFLGGKVDPQPQTFWFLPGKWEGVPLRDIKPAYDANEPWWKAVVDITKACVAKFDRRAQFGFTDFGGNLDIAASLRDTQTLLMDCIDDPEGVDALVSAITQLWLRYYDEMHAIIKTAGRGTSPWAPIWSPGRCYMLQSDFSYMISPEQFERWVVPDLTACCRRLDHSFYHLDGKGELPHLDHLLSIPELHGIQWVSGDGQPSNVSPHWHWLLKRVRGAGKLMQQWGTVKELTDLAKEMSLKGFIFNVSGLGADPNAALESIWKEAEFFRKKEKPTVAV